MEIGGLPLHALVIHAAVVFGPLAALTALAYAVLGRWRDRLRWPMVLIALVATGSVVMAYLSGNALLDSQPGLGQVDHVQTHQDRATVLLPVALAFGVVAVLAGWLHDRGGGVRMLMTLLLAVAAAGMLVMVVLTGDAGSRAVWEGVVTG